MKNMFTILIALAFSLNLTAQDYKVRPSESSMSIKGTSTLHDWESVVETFSAVARVKEDVIENASFKAEVKSIKSGTSAMDANTYKAMNEPEHPSISFKATGPIRQSGSALRIKGELTIAGVTKPIEFTATGERWSEESLTVKGSYKLKMSDYGIDPPKAMLGTIRTGDEVTIDFEFVMYQ
jgi:polyisoprenoid-binding protein YceI